MDFLIPIIFQNERQYVYGNSYDQFCEEVVAILNIRRGFKLRDLTSQITISERVFDKYVEKKKHLIDFTIEIVENVNDLKPSTSQVFV